MLLTASWGGGAHPKKNKKKPKKTKPIYQFWCSDWFFFGFFGIFWFFFGFFWFFLVFFCFFWDDIPTLKSNAKKKQKIPKKTKKPKNQFPISNVGQSLSQKNQKIPKKQKKTVSNFEFWPKPMPKKQKKQKKTKKTNANLEILKNQKKTKKTKKKPMPICRFWCSDWFFLVFLGEHPPPHHRQTLKYQEIFLLNCSFIYISLLTILTKLLWIMLKYFLPGLVCFL